MSHFFNPSYPVARKRHQCDECWRWIEPGEIYRRQTGIIDHMFHSKLCAHCHKVWSFIWREEHYIDPEDAYEADAYLEGYDGLYALRLRACLRAKWRFQTGMLMPVPEQEDKA